MPPRLIKIFAFRRVLCVSAFNLLSEIRVHPWLILPAQFICRERQHPAGVLGDKITNWPARCRRPRDF
jgi:hypothetical protein